MEATTVVFLCNKCQVMCVSASHLREHQKICEAGKAEDYVEDVGDIEELEDMEENFDYAIKSQVYQPRTRRRTKRPAHLTDFEVEAAPLRTHQTLDSTDDVDDMKVEEIIEENVTVGLVTTTRETSAETEKPQMSSSVAVDEQGADADTEKEPEEGNKVIKVEFGTDFVVAAPDEDEVGDGSGDDESESGGSDDGKNPPCDQCGYQATDARARHRHMRTHTRPLQCSVCYRRFARAHELQVHELIHTGEKPHECRICGYKTRHANALKEHQRKHLGLRFQCDVEGCEFTTVYRRALDMHRKRHTGRRDHVCSQCGYGTFDAAAFRRHMKTHSSAAKAFKCELCEYRAHEKYSVLRHMQCKHLGQRKYHCDQCDFSSAYLSGLKTHLMTHLNVRPFQCSVCYYSSNMKDKVKRHVLQRHKGVGEIIDNCLRLKINVDHFIRHEPLAPQALLQLAENGHTDLAVIETKKQSVQLTQGKDSDGVSTLYITPADSKPPVPTDENNALVIHLTKQSPDSQPQISQIQSCGAQPAAPLLLSVDHSCKDENAEEGETIVHMSQLLQLYSDEMNKQNDKSTETIEGEAESGGGRTPNVQLKVSVPVGASASLLHKQSE